MGFAALLQAGQEVRIVSVVGVGGDAGVANPPRLARSNDVRAI
jgi:hypothetical protein